MSSDRKKKSSQSGAARVSNTTTTVYDYNNDPDLKNNDPDLKEVPSEVFYEKERSAGTYQAYPYPPPSYQSSTASTGSTSSVIGSNSNIGVDLEAGGRIENNYTNALDNAAEGCCATGPWCGNDSDHFVDDKKLLLRRVYSALTVQMIITGIICFLFITNEKAMTGLLQYSTVAIWGGFAVAIAILIFLYCCEGKDKYPINLVMLLIFTGCMSMLVAVACSSVSCQYDAETKLCSISQEGQGIVIQALIITMAIFISLTAFELQTKKDFSCMGQILCIGLVILIIWGCLISAFGWHTPMLYSLFGAILFTGYILYDTSNIVNVYGPDDWIPATIQLYLDIINLFLSILQLLSGGSRSND